MTTEACLLGGLTPPFLALLPRGEVGPDFLVSGWLSYSLFCCYLASSPYTLRAAALCCLLALLCNMFYKLAESFELKALP